MKSNSFWSAAKSITPLSHGNKDISERSNSVFSCGGVVGGTGDNDDFDGDGICNDTDLDDDNDGIADNEEKTATFGLLLYEFYDGTPSGNTVDNIPTTGALSEGTVSSFDVGSLQESVDPGDTETYSIRYSGSISIPSDDTYTFYLVSDDGSKLYINDNLIVDNDGIHSVVQVTGNVFLTTGTHSIRVEYFENTGTNTLDLLWSTPGNSSVRIPFANFSAPTDQDTDNDGLLNRLDLDSDNDGIPDIVELGGTDVDGNGTVDLSTDTDLDGLVDLYDIDNGGTSLIANDADSDGAANYVDLDSDNDMIPDNFEGQSTLSYVGFSSLTDTDNDGIIDAYDPDQGGNLISTPQNTDETDNPDYLDLDSDNDGTFDIQEQGVSVTDNNADGMTDNTVGFNGMDDVLEVFDNHGDPNGIYDNSPSNNFPDNDSDVLLCGGDVDYRDSLAGLYACNADEDDFDNDGLINGLDQDDDNDGLPDIDEYYFHKYKLQFDLVKSAPAGNTVDNIPEAGQASSFTTNFDVNTIQQTFYPESADGYAIRFFGVIDIPASDNYTFYTASDDGSKLYIDGSEVVDNDGLHTYQQASGSVILSKGLHEFEVRFFESTGSAGLAVLWSTGGNSPTNIPFTNFGQLSEIDLDGDGRKNRFDLDSDNDGIPDLVEAGGVDVNGDGLVDGSFLDSDSDGLADAYDPDSGGTALSITDHDGDLLYQTIDRDTDNDGISDFVEAGGTDDDGDGLFDVAFADSDGDGYADFFDPSEGGTPLNITDTDGDGLPDFMDLDSDNDGIPDNIEVQSTLGFIHLTDTTDTDADGIANSYDPDHGGTALNHPVNTDGTDNPDYQDLDSDNDGVFDIAESPNSAFDTDMDGKTNNAIGSNGLDNYLGNDDFIDPNGSLDNSFASIFPDTDNDLNHTCGGDLDYRDNISGTFSCRLLTGNDNDGDGVSDFDDIDDDNDGILDTNEGVDLFGFLNYEFYDSAPSGDTVDNIPTTGACLAGVATGINLSNLKATALSAGCSTSEYAVRYSGFISIETQANYTFYLRSENGSKIYIDNQLIVDNDGLAVFSNEVSSTTNLTQGDHAITIEYFHKTGLEVLAVQYESPSIPKAQLPFSILSVNKSGCATCDADADGVEYRFDSDNDNDGMPDIVEAGGADTNNDGIADGTFVDTDGDGWADIFDPDNGGTPLARPDTDVDSYVNYLDLDSDNDGIPDIVEAGGTDSDSNGRVDGTFSDTDNDGFSNTFDADNGGTPLPIPDTDGDTFKDYLDLDSDNDANPDNQEAQTTKGYIGLNDNNDADGDGLKNSYDPDQGGVSLSNPVNTDGTDTPDYLDLDSDNDGLFDVDELNSGVNLDSDNDGRVDGNVNPTGLVDFVNTSGTYTDPNGVFADDGTYISLLDDDDGDALYAGDVNYRDIHNGVPGAVAENLLFWVRADAGGLSWTDQSGSNHSVTKQNTVGSGPMVNYNPTNLFDGSSGGYYDVNLNIDAVTHPELTVWAVYVPESATGGPVWGEDDGSIFDRQLIDAGGFRNQAVGDGINMESGIINLFDLSVPNLTTVIYDEDITNGSSVFAEGKLVRSFTADNSSSSSNPLQIGSEGSNASLFDGEIAELIVFNQKFTDLTQRQLVESYLALKWGITLSDDSDNDGTPFETTEGDYIVTSSLSSGTRVNETIWDASANNTFHHNIAGIVIGAANASVSGFTQKQSKSSNSDAIVSIGLDDDLNGLESSNANNTSANTSNLKALVWGHDGEQLHYGGPSTDMDPLIFQSRLKREWRVQETNSIGTVTVEFDVSNLLGPTGVGTNDESQIVLLTDTDGDFSQGANVTHQSFEVSNDGKVKFRVDFSNGDYFTLGSTEYVALAVNFVSFDAIASRSSVQLAWSTSDEINNSYFEVERSENGISFKSIAQVEPKATDGVNRYEWMDRHPLKGTSYYRIVGNDFSGEKEFTEVRQIRVTEQPKTTLPYPNPAKIGDLIYLDLEENKIIRQITLTDLVGREIAIDRRIDSSGRLILETSSLKAGAYLLRVISEDDVLKFKILITND